MPVVIGGWDSPESFMDAVNRGEMINPSVPLPAGIVQTGVDEYVEMASQPPMPWVSPAITGIGNTVLGTMTNPTPGVMINPIMAGVWSGFDPNDTVSGLAIIRAYSLEVYGSTDLGVVRYSSEVLENEPTGVRPGTMERIVIPAWARRERGSPL